MNRTMVRQLQVAAVISLVIVCLWVLDWSLEKTEVRELQAEAQREYASGARLLKNGEAEKAIELIRRAHTLDRNNLTYELTLIEALMAARKTQEAEPLLQDILERDSNGGRTNLIAARLAARKGNPGEAESYYHRAIYGSWPDNAEASRRAARVELVEFLYKNNRNGELLPELLPLEAEAGGAADLNHRIAHLFLAAGSPIRAAELYRTLIHQQPEDANLYADLGEAELVAGQYRRAVAAFVAAFRYKPNDSSLRKRMELSSMLSGLDPTSRQLSSGEKYRRALHILELSSAAYQRCTGQQPGEDQDRNVRPDRLRDINNEIAEQKLARAEELWRTRIEKCGASTSSEEEALRLIMAKLAQYK